MITLVTGGSGSGKSEYGEELVLSLNSQVRYYIATMEVFGEEGRAKVQRHRRLRQGKGFITVERLRDLGSLKLDGGREEGKSSVLLECVSNLAANEMFGGRTLGEGGSIEALASGLARDIASVAARADDMVIITNEVGSDGRTYDRETMDYIRLMGLLNRRLADMADQVVEVVFGIPVVLKPPPACVKGALEK
ncbi:MAG: bifunctional adenosylcobinamide kinase/adenosylcobinamide-phosphate guanylyltransferase [Clostridium sp.]|nr:bifunctional adenosylcobinamide kinase/adenosylcobinamide-phosphate guanylyltransferase [Clostridium sp.]